MHTFPWAAAAQRPVVPGLTALSAAAADAEGKLMVLNASRLREQMRQQALLVSPHFGGAHALL